MLGLGPVYRAIHNDFDAVITPDTARSSKLCPAVMGQHFAGMETEIPRSFFIWRCFLIRIPDRDDLAGNQRLSSTRRGARLARLPTVERLQAWQVSPSVTQRAEQIVAELAANAALHGRVQGRDFEVALTLDAATGTVRISVTDAQGEQLPIPRRDFEAPADSESGRGLILVAALAYRWGTEPYRPSGRDAKIATRVIALD